MMRITGFLRTALLFLVVWACFVGAAISQAYPVKPIRIIDAFPPGGASDVLLRMIQPKFQENVGQPFVIDYRPGAQGISGTDVAAKSPPDGYTYVMFPNSFAVHPSVYKNLPYDLTKSFTPVTWLTHIANVLVVHPSVPAKSVKELIALAKAKPGSLNFASPGYGSTAHVTMELFKYMAGVNIIHIPYKGIGQAVPDTMAGHVDMIFAPLPVAAPYIQSGKLRALGVCTPKRTIAMPDLPTIAEAGVPGFVATNAVGMLAPAGTPRELVGKMQQELARVLTSPEIRDQLRGLGAEVVASTPEQFGEYIRTEIAKWQKVIKATGMELQPW